MATNPFEKKTWQNRLSEHPTRRQLVDVDTGTTQTVDVTRAEGQIYTTGDGFTQTNMNDLEQRIYDAFDDFDGAGALSHNIPRAVPKDITDYYNDDTLWDRLNGTNGFDLYEDIFVGDYFTLNTGPITCKNLSEQETVTGASKVLIAHLFQDGSFIILPAIVDDNGKAFAHHFGKTYVASSLQEFQDNGLTEFFEEVIGMANTLSEVTPSTSDGATLLSRMVAEFGTSHIRALAPGTAAFPNGYDANYNITGLSAYNSYIGLLNEIHLRGFPDRDSLHTSYSGTRKLSIYNNCVHLSFFSHGGQFASGNLSGGYNLVGVPIDQDYMAGDTAIVIFAASQLFGNQESWKYLAICPLVHLK